MHVNNVAPTAPLSGPTSVDEGSTHTYSFTVTDPGLRHLHRQHARLPRLRDRRQLRRRPSLTTNLGGGSFDCTFPDGPTTTDVKIRVTDSDGASDTDTENVVVVTVANVNPTADLDNDGPVDEGSPATYQLHRTRTTPPTDIAAGFTLRLRLLERRPLRRHLRKLEQLGLDDLHLPRR